MAADLRAVAMLTAVVAIIISPEASVPIKASGSPTPLESSTSPSWSPSRTSSPSWQSTLLSSSPSPTSNLDSSFSANQQSNGTVMCSHVGNMTNSTGTNRTCFPTASPFTRGPTATRSPSTLNPTTLHPTSVPSYSPSTYSPTGPVKQLVSFRLDFRNVTFNELSPRQKTNFEKNIKRTISWSENIPTRDIDVVDVETTDEEWTIVDAQALFGSVPSAEFFIVVMQTNCSTVFSTINGYNEQAYGRPRVLDIRKGILPSSNNSKDGET
mmetsp:Transcript_1965/g.4490  ORF Transcript_1965/g.4490 Transcript_1965/m.4490 type:complete len:268 (-) Transcript_1965:77-880(-)